MRRQTEESSLLSHKTIESRDQWAQKSSPGLPLSRPRGKHMAELTALFFGSQRRNGAASLRQSTTFQRMSAGPSRSFRPLRAPLKKGSRFAKATNLKFLNLQTLVLRHRECNRKGNDAAFSSAPFRLHESTAILLRIWHLLSLQFGQRMSVAFPRPKSPPPLQIPAFQGP